MKQIIVFMVAGMSSRFGGSLPKQFAKVGPNYETLIELSVQDALSVHFDEIVFITNPKTEHLFRDLFKNVYKRKPVHYLPQNVESFRQRPWGTTDAVCVLSQFPEKDSIFTIVNGDDLYGKSAFQLMEKNLSKNVGNYIGGLPILDTIIGDEKVNRGVITCDFSRVVNIEERLNISRTDNDIKNCLANVNFLILLQSTIQNLNRLLQNFKTKHEGDPKIECFLTDCLNELIHDGKLEMAYIPLEEKVIGVTRQEDVEKVRQNLLKR